MIVSSMQQDHKKYHAFVFLSSLLPKYDTIDYDILITRLSPWFGIHRSVLSWFKSHLSSRSFHVKCDNIINNLSSFHTSSCGVPRGSFLGPLLFIMYTTPLSTLISFLSLDHYLYADNTQLFSVRPLNHLSPSKRSSTISFR